MKNASSIALFILTLFYALIFGGILIGAVIFFIGFILELSKTAPIALPLGIFGLIYLIVYQVAAFGKK